MWQAKFGCSFFPAVQSMAVTEIWACVCCQSVSHSVGLEKCHHTGDTRLSARVQLALVVHLLGLVAKMVVECE